MGFTHSMAIMPAWFRTKTAVLPKGGVGFTHSMAIMPAWFRVVGVTKARNYKERILN